MFMRILAHQQPPISSALWYILIFTLTIFICILFTKQSSACSVVLFPSFSSLLSSNSFLFPLFCLLLDNTCLLLSPLLTTSLKCKENYRDSCQSLSPLFSQLFSSHCAFCEAALFCDTLTNILFILIMKLWHTFIRSEQPNNLPILQFCCKLFTGLKTQYYVSHNI